MDSARLSQELSSDSDSEDQHQFNPNSQRLQFLAAAGLVQRPITQRQQELPPPPPPDSTTNPTPSISFQTCPIPTQDTSPTRPHAPAENDPLSKMEAAFARYLNIQQDQPCTSGLSVSAPRQASRTRNASQSVSGHRPSSEQLKSARTPCQNWNTSSSHRPSSSGSAPPSTTNHIGFRSWLSGISKSVSTANTPSGLTWLPDRRQSSSSSSSSSGPSARFTHHSPDARRPSVSGPIHTVDELPEPRRPSVASNLALPSTIPSSHVDGHHGTRTWSSMIDPTILSQYTEKEKNRQEAIYELIKTESSFVESCEILTQVYYQELEPILGMRAMAIIFGNIEDIMLFGTTFLSALEERKQLDSLSIGFHHIQNVGDILVDYMQGVEVFKPYCSNQANAIRTLIHLKLNPFIANKLNSLKVKGLEFEHYLLQPMQRLTRYPLLISQIIKFTEEESQDYVRLNHALQKVQQVLVATNEAIREQEHEIALATLSEQLMIPGSDAKLNLATMTRFVGPRRLIREGVLTKPRSRKTFRAYLFNDFFLLAKTTMTGGGGGGVVVGILESSCNSTSNSSNSNNTNQNRRKSQSIQMVMYRAPMALEECQLIPGKDDLSFTIVHHNESFSLKVPDGNIRSCLAWINDFKTARKNVFKALATRKSKRASWTTNEEKNEDEPTRLENSRKNKTERNHLYPPDYLNNTSSSIIQSHTDPLNMLLLQNSSSSSGLSSLNRSSIRLMM
ncbi:hypothetical protein PSTG_15540 [Puccinia striiformis f. sp. tritici PST-78]|uniref:DH domain-containing protein n=1 Tax=Puccinia striiformis f. sp. tritici PST-78 TaxID=1165861 RepID=A0A0L0UVH2_9BASI|nr:hypothetical protein PSTG_15540 [Puccinia striiformis f. sp. tritici PST-78]